MEQIEKGKKKKEGKQREKEGKKNSKEREGVRIKELKK